MDAAVRYIVAVQEHAGLDVITDGEWRRKSYIGVIAELAHGFELGYNPQDNRPWTIVVDKLAPKDPGFIAHEIAFLRQSTDRQIKATLPSPALLGERLWHADFSAKAYPKRNDFVRDCAEILRREIDLVCQAGADIIQIDDPHLCLFVDPVVRGQFPDPDAAADFAVEMVNAIVDTRQKTRFAVHLCRRAGARVRGEANHAGSYERILDQLNRLNVDHLTMEFTAPSAGDMAVLKRLRGDFEIGLGCVSVMPGEIDAPASIAARVRRAAQFLEPGRMVLNPDCGFAPGSGAPVSIDEAYRKLCNMVAAAAMLREEFA